MFITGKNCFINDALSLQILWEDKRTSPWYGTISIKQTKIDPKGLDKQRSDRMQFHQYFEAGWHFSNFNFGQNRYVTKLKNFAHQEFSHPDTIKYIMDNIESYDQSENIRILSLAELYCNLPHTVFSHPYKYMNETGLTLQIPFPSQFSACGVFLNELKKNSLPIPQWIINQYLFS